MPRATRRIQEIPPYVFAVLAERKRIALQSGPPMIDLSLGSPDQPTPAPIIEALRAAALDTTRHGYPPMTGDPGFKRAFAAWMGRRFGVTVDPETEVVPTAGAKEALAHLIATYCGEGDVLLIPDVAYPVYERAAIAAGADTVLLPVTAAGGWWPDFSAIDPAVLRRAKILLLNYPNNPIGATATLAQWTEAVAFARQHDLLLVSDLAYSELTFDGTPAPSVFQVPGAHDVAVEIHSGSKNFSMAGLRLGIVTGRAEVCTLLNKYRNLVGYGAPTVVQLAGITAYDQADALAAGIRAGYAERFKAALAGFAEGGHDIGASPAAAMYLWLPVPAGMSDWEFVERLMAEERIVATPGSGFGPGGNGYVRFSMVAAPDTLREACRRAAGMWR